MKSWCPYCKHKGESKLFETLSEYFEMRRKCEFEWCKNIKCLPFDMKRRYSKLLFELDGRQHFQQVMKWMAPEETRDNDKYKMKCANENGYSVIRLLQDDVLYDKNNWLKKLLKAVKEIDDDGMVQNIFICSNGEYDVYTEN